MLVMKFGGTSIGNAQRMRHVAQLVLQNEGKKIVVLSAMAGTTDALIRICRNVIENNIEEAKNILCQLKEKYRLEINALFPDAQLQAEVQDTVNKHFDLIEQMLPFVFTEREEKITVAQGELISSFMFYRYMESLQADVRLLPALEFMKIDENGEPDYTFIANSLKAQLAKHPAVDTYITQGFICRNTFGNIDNLKRGGSDYTASIIGAVINATEIQIWTDIDGVHNNDPRYVKGTKPIRNLSFDEAAELAYFGAKVLHPSSVLPARKKGIPVRLKNTLEPDAFGTVISNSSTGEGIKAVAAKDGLTVIKIKSSRMLMAYGFLRKVFEVFELYKTPIDVIATSEVAVSLSIDNDRYLDDITRELKKLGEVEVDKDLSIICVVGDFPDDSHGYASKVFEALREIPIRMISYGGSRHNISIVVKTSYKPDALNSLHSKLFMA